VFSFTELVLLQLNRILIDLLQFLIYWQVSGFMLIISKTGMHEAYFYLKISNNGLQISEAGFYY